MYWLFSSLRVMSASTSTLIMAEFLHYKVIRLHHIWCIRVILYVQCKINNTRIVYLNWLKRLYLSVRVHWLPSNSAVMATNHCSRIRMSKMSCWVLMRPQNPSLKWSTVLAMATYTGMILLPQIVLGI